MLTGFNTDIESHGRVFHVQTQEKGLVDPVVESLVYCGGQVVTLVRFSYAALIDTPQYSDEAVLRLMEYQHRRMIRDIRDGKFASSPESSVARGRVSERSLDEVVLDYLERSVDATQRIELTVEHLAGPNAREADTREPAIDAGARRPEDSQSAVAVSTPSRTEHSEAERRVLERLERFLDAVQRDSAGELGASTSVGLHAEPSTSAARTTTRRRRPRHRSAVWIVIAAAAALAVVLWISPSLEVRNRDFSISPGVRRVAREVSSPSKATAADDAIEHPGTPKIRGANDGAAVESTGGPPSYGGTVAPVTGPAGVVSAPAMPAKPVVLEGKAATTTRAVAEKTEPPEKPERRAMDAASIAPPPATKLRKPTAEEPASPEPTQPRRVDWTGKLVDIAAVDAPPWPTQRDLPRYTKRARRLRQQGVVSLELLVSEHGRVLETRTVRAIPDSDLDQAALAAARTWRFTPATKAGFPVRVWKPIEIEFSISPGKSTKIRIRD